MPPEHVADWQLERVRLRAADGDYDSPKGYQRLGHVLQRGPEQFQGRRQSAHFAVPPPPGDDALTVPKPGRR
jgi:hypothetical protein